MSNGTETKNGKISTPTSTNSTPSSNLTPTSASSTPTSTTSTSSSSSSSSNGSITEIPWGSRTVEIFERLEQVGAGTYGQVFKAKNKVTGEIVALKRVRMDQEKEGLPITAIREIKILKELRHENIVALKEIVTSKDYDKGKGSIYMVFEYMDHDLTGLMDSNHSNYFTLPQIKCYMKQLLEGLWFCHKKNVLHRDVKGSNLLINNKGVLKIADFGLARFYNESARGQYTNRVITLWYRPPELLFGAVSYGPAVDMWSAGCILAELLSKKPTFPGKDEVQQLELIWKICGSPTEENWPDVEELPLCKMLRPQRIFKRRLREVFKNFPELGLDLLEKMLTLDPKQRIDAGTALDHDFFWTDPMPDEPSSLPQYESCHEWNSKKRKQQAQQQQQQQQEQANKRMRPDFPPAGPPGGSNRPPPTSGSQHPYPHHHPYPPSHHQNGPSHYPQHGSQQQQQHSSSYGRPPGHGSYPSSSSSSHHPPTHHQRYAPPHQSSHHTSSSSSSHHPSSSSHPPHSSSNYPRESSSSHPPSSQSGPSYPPSSSSYSSSSAAASNPWGQHHQSASYPRPPSSSSTSSSTRPPQSSSSNTSNNPPKPPAP